MRELILDTETTGLDPDSGDKLVEIGIVELIGHRPSGIDLHYYLNPQRSVPLDAYNVHGLDYDFLKDKPTFSDIADELLEFLGNDTIIIHNVAFDLKFLNHELAMANKKLINVSQTFCTLDFARNREGNKRASLDALSREFRSEELDRLTENRSKKGGHGALLDSYILAEVYLGLIGGREPDMFEQHEKKVSHDKKEKWHSQPVVDDKKNNFIRPKALPIRLTSNEVAKHKEFLKRIKGFEKWSIYN